MKIEKQIILKIELSSTDLEEFINMLEIVLAANVSANQGLGFLDTKEEKYVKQLLKNLTS